MAPTSLLGSSLAAPRSPRAQGQINIQRTDRSITVPCPVTQFTADIGIHCFGRSSSSRAHYKWTVPSSGGKRTEDSDIQALNTPLIISAAADSSEASVDSTDESGLTLFRDGVHGRLRMCRDMQRYNAQINDTHVLRAIDFQTRINDTAFVARHHRTRARGVVGRGEILLQPRRDLLVGGDLRARVQLLA